MIPILLVALIVCLPFWSMSEAKRARQSFEKAVMTPCPNCGQPFGETEVTRAREIAVEERRKLFAEARAQGIRLRVAPTRWRLRCPSCGAEFEYLPESETLVEVGAEDLDD